MPTVAQALQHLDRELARARQAGCGVVKLVHGYGSAGAGGEIRVAVQRRLAEMAGRGEIRACIFGEDWAKSDEQAWALIKARTELKQDHDLGRRNLGITIVQL
jgi:hypothetical protein